MLTEMLQSEQAETAEAEKTSGQAKTTQTFDVVGTLSTPPPIQSIPPCSISMPYGFVMISQAIWDKTKYIIG